MSAVKVDITKVFRVIKNMELEGPPPEGLLEECEKVGMEQAIRSAVGATKQRTLHCLLEAYSKGWLD